MGRQRRSRGIWNRDGDNLLLLKNVECPFPPEGRDHHSLAFTIWMAGGGVRAGHSVGQTDPLGYAPTTAPIFVRDLQATILHLMGLDNERLVYPFQGLDQKLTGVQPARVVKEVLA